MPGFWDLSRLPAGEQVLWLLVKGGNFLTRDVRKFACLPVHKDLRYNLLEYIIQPLRDRNVLAARRALRLALRTVVGDQAWEYRLDRDLDLSWVTEFFYRIATLFECISSPKIFADGSRRTVITRPLNRYSDAGQSHS
jgi:hypothetical protein